MKTESRQIKFWYALIQIMLWGGYGVTICYCSNFLKSMDFKDSHVSIVLGTASALAIIVQLFLAELIQKIRRLSTGKVIAGQAGILLVAGVLMLENPNMAFVAAAGIGIGCVVLQTIPSLANSLATESEQSGYAVNFPIARGMGSLAYSVVSFMTGRLIGNAGIKIIAILTIMTGAVLCLSAVMFEGNTGNRKNAQKAMPGNEKEENMREAGQESAQAFFAKYPFLIMFLAGSILLYINHNLVSTFMQQIIEAKGAGAGEQGTAIAISGIMELPAMFGFSYLLKKASCAKWVRVSGWCFLIKAVLILLAPNYIWIYIAQIFQMGGFAIYTVSSVEYIGSVIEAEDAVRAQTYLATTMTAGSLIAMLTGGFICQYAGVNIMTGTAAILAAAGLAVICMATRKKEQY